MNLVHHHFSAWACCVAIQLGPLFGHRGSQRPAVSGTGVHHRLASSNFETNSSAMSHLDQVLAPRDGLPPKERVWRCGRGRACSPAAPSRATAAAASAASPPGSGSLLVVATPAFALQGLRFFLAAGIGRGWCWLLVGALTVFERRRVAAQPGDLLLGEKFFKHCNCTLFLILPVLVVKISGL